MKELFISLSALVLFAACSSSDNASNATEQALVSDDKSGVNYIVNPQESKLGWVAKKIVGGHEGFVNISGGSLNYKDGNILSGNFSIDMASIVNTDITDAEMNGKLVGHLSSPDFFNVSAFPTGKFEITASGPIQNDPNGFTHNISGNLTIKDSVKNISFPVKVIADENNISAEGSVIINRLDFGIVYNSVSVSPAALLSKLGDNAIKDEVEIKISLKANKE